MKYTKAEDLPVWKDSISLVKKLYKEINNWSFKNDFVLQDQIKRSVISIPSNIAEGFSRKTWNEFLRFLDISLWSLSEFYTQIYIAYEIGYLNKEKFDSFNKEISNIEKQIKSLILYLNNK